MAMHGVVPGDIATPSRKEHHGGGDRSHTLSVALSPWRFRFVWLTVAAMCALNGLIGLLYVALYYVGFTLRNGYLVEVIGMLPLRDVPILIASYLLITLFFWQHLLSMLVASVYHRRLAFPSKYWFKSSHLKERACQPLRCWPQKWLPSWANIWRETVTGEAFEIKFLLRELVEIALQTYQAYKCSTLISQTYINSFYVATLTANCWIAPIIYLTTHHKPAVQRLLYLISDLVLDFGSALLIPAWTLYAMVLMAVFENAKRQKGTDFAFDAPYDDVFLINVIKAAQQICAMSWLDYTSKMMPFVSMGSCLLHAEALLTTPVRDNGLKTSPGNVLQSATAPAPSTGEATQSSDVSVPFGHSRKLLMLRMVYVAFAAWGAAVLAAHLEAAWSSQNAMAIERVGCKSSSRPWLRDQFSCNVLEINCYRRGIEGTADEIDGILRPLNPAALNSLIIAHCSRLSISPRIQTFSNLIGLELANSTLVDWGSDAALLNDKHPSLQFLTLVRLNMTALPDALQATQFPRQLRNFNIVATNLTTLPEDLHTKWQRLLNVYADRSRFMHVPSTLGRLRLDILSVLGNNISDIPDDLLAGNRYSVISVARNPIKKLPADIGTVGALTMVIMDYTEIETLPTWLLAEGELRAKTMGSTITVSAGGSVFCENRLSSGDTTTLPGLKLSCRLKEDAEFEAYPYTFSQTNRQP